MMNDKTVMTSNYKNFLHMMSDRNDGATQHKK
jgi:hypothetical protein